MARKKLDNPLTSLNIPPRPEQTIPEEMSITEQPPSQEHEPAPQQRPKKAEIDRARIQVSTYFSIPQYTKLQDMEKEYLRMTGRKTDPNKILRKLIEKATIDDIL